mmetsp:Transcript_26225/g.68883  ORF Transcript_26225/g.68883 Transcript_26225/m.68883 type:complete len:214 (-) Transcript_26225:1741-2382(-)
MAAEPAGAKAGPADNDKPTVAVDIDEVLCAFVDPLARFTAATFGATATAADFFSYTFREVWKCDEAESTKRVQAFLESADFESGLPVLTGARKGLGRLAQKYRLVAVTSRQTQIKVVTEAWIDREFPELFAAVHFGNHWGLTGEKRSKSEMCRAEGAVCLIDDSPKYVRQCATALDSAILFGEYPWNRVPDGEPLPPNAQRATSWDEVLEVLL